MDHVASRKNNTSRDGPVVSARKMHTRLQISVAVQLPSCDDKATRTDNASMTVGDDTYTASYRTSALDNNYYVPVVSIFFLDKKKERCRVYRSKICGPPKKIYTFIRSEFTRDAIKDDAARPLRINVLIYKYAHVCDAQLN